MRNHRRKFNVMNKNVLSEERLRSIVRHSLNEAMKDSFSYEVLSSLKSYSQRVKYCKEQLGQPIGNGSSRMVFQIDDEKCLKLAKNEKGVAQNEVEYDWYAQKSGVMSKLYNCDNDYLWIVAEYVLPAKKADFKECLGIDWNTFCTFVVSCYAEYTPQMRYHYNSEKLYALCEKCEWLDWLHNYMLDFRPPCGDLTAIRNYGLTLRDGKPTIVILDSGLSQSVWEEYYSR